MFKIRLNYLESIFFLKKGYARHPNESPSFWGNKTCQFQPGGLHNLLGVPLILYCSLWYCHGAKLFAVLINEEDAWRDSCLSCTLIRYPLNLGTVHFSVKMALCIRTKFPLQIKSVTRGIVLLSFPSLPFLSGTIKCTIKVPRFHKDSFQSYNFQDVHWITAANYPNPDSQHAAHYYWLYLLCSPLNLHKNVAQNIPASKLTGFYKINHFSGVRTIYPSAYKLQSHSFLQLLSIYETS